MATVIAAAHHASGLVTNAETSQLELAESKMAEDRACITANLSDEFSIQFPDALSAAVGSLMPDAAPSAEATLLRLQAEDLHSDSVSTAPKTSFKQKYSDQPGQSLNAESAYEMFHNIFYIAESCTASFSDLINLRGKHRPDGIEDYGTRLCYQEIQLLSDASSTLGGRTILVLVLNQFRSKKVKLDNLYFLL